MTRVWDVLRPWLFPVACLGCGAPDVGLCPECGRAAPIALRSGGIVVCAAAPYDGLIRTAVIAMKRGERAYLEPLAALVAPLVPRGAVLVPVCTTRRRAAERGFDQARELAARAARRCEGAVADVLRKRGGPQHGLGRRARLAAGGRFTLVQGRSLPAAAVLVDDVITTGATLADAASVLVAAGCRVGGAVVVARTPAPGETSRRRRRLVET
jgi:predicted amidophosphoribosyltransferase